MRATPSQFRTEILQFWFKQMPVTHANLTFSERLLVSVTVSEVSAGEERPLNLGIRTQGLL